MIDDAFKINERDNGVIKIKKKKKGGERKNYSKYSRFEYKKKKKRRRGKKFLANRSPRQSHRRFGIFLEFREIRGIRLFSTENFPGTRTVRPPSLNGPQFSTPDRGRSVS